MTKALSTKNNLGFVDGSILEPSNPDSPLFQASWRCNDMVIYFMKFVKIQNVRYIQRNGQKLFELKKALACHPQGSLTVGELSWSFCEKN